MDLVHKEEGGGEGGKNMNRSIGEGLEAFFGGGN